MRLQIDKWIVKGICDQCGQNHITMHVPALSNGTTVHCTQNNAKFKVAI